MINTIINISSFKRTYNDKFNNNTSDYKIEHIAELDAPEFKRHEGTNIILQEDVW